MPQKELPTANDVQEAARELMAEFGDRGARHVLRAARVAAARLGRMPGLGETFDKLGAATVEEFGYAGVIKILYRYYSQSRKER